MMTSNRLPKMRMKLGTLIQVVRIYSENIEMEFAIEKCAMIIRKSGKWQMTEGIKPPNQEIIRKSIETETYEYLGILKAEDKIKIKREREKYSKPNYIAKISPKG